jgi:hypothetical protein
MVGRRTSLSQSGLTFFGLTPEYRGNLFTQIHEILFYGNGGYNYDTLYNMPIWLRKFTYNKILEHYDKKTSQKQNDAVEQSINAMKSAGAVSKNKVNVPTYVTKASKK